MSAPDYEPTIIENADTIVKLFRLRVSRLGDKTAMREKNFGVWESFSWKEYGRKARQIGMGLLSLGLRRGDVCSILSENNKEWLFSEMGVLCVGGVSSGVYTTDSPKQLEYLLNDSNSKFLFVEDEEQLDKYLEIRSRVPSVEKVIVYDLEGLSDFKDEKVIGVDELCRQGSSHDQKHKGLWNKSIDESRPRDLMILIYTSGTTGPPKGAMISHANCMFQIETFAKILPINENDEQLSFLPLCHIAEKLFSVLLPLKSEGTVNFAERPDTVPENIREVSPTIFFAVPRIWEKFFSYISLQAKDATRFGRWAFNTAISVGKRAADLKISGRRLPATLKIAYWLAQKTVLNNIRRMLGLDRVRWTATGAAPISPDLIKWHYALGIDMVEVFGQTECCGLATVNPIGKIKPGAAGKSIPETRMKISEKGEILIKGPHVFLGYLSQPEKTAETVIDGWLHTGDAGRVDQDEYYTIVDRLKDIIITAGGKNISPSEIENQLKFSPYITDAVVIGDRRKYLSSLIMIDRENVEKFAQDNDAPYTDYASLCGVEEVRQLIWKEISKVNKNVARVENIRKFRVIDQLLTAEDEELTPTMKLKRKFVNAKYADLIESMYS